MPGPMIQGTFATGNNAVAGNTSDILDVPEGITVMKLTTLGLDGSNTIKTQKTITPGTAWADQVTYNSDQTNVSITVADNEKWRLIGVTQQAVKDIRYKMSCES